MLAAILLAFALLIPGSSAGTGRHCQERSQERREPTTLLGLRQEVSPLRHSHGSPEKSKDTVRRSQKLAGKKQLDAALDKVTAARTISPLDMVYASAQKRLEGKLADKALREGNQAMLAGDTAAALAAFRRAAELDPANDYAEQRLHDALPTADELGNARFRARLGETRLEPATGVHSFEYKGDSIRGMQQFAQIVRHRLGGGPGTEATQCAHQAG